MFETIELTAAKANLKLQVIQRIEPLKANCWKESNQFEVSFCR